MRKNAHKMQATRRVVAVLLFMGMAFTAKAQVFMMDGDENYREPEDPAVFVNLPSNYGMGTDYYLPVGDGIVLLAALGGAYLLRKSKKDNKSNKISNK